MLLTISNVKAVSCLTGVLCLGVIEGCELMQGESVKTLAEIAKSEQGKETVLQQEEQSFQGLRLALSQGVLPPGTTAEEITRNYGPPVVEISGDNYTKWLYKSPQGSWFKAPKVALFLNQESRLERWECTPEDICRAIEIKQDIRPID